MKKIYTIIILALIAGNVNSQTGVTTYTIPFNSFKTCFGLDGLGNKWFGTTSAGLIKFDGTNYTHYDTLTCGIPDNRIYCFAFDGFNNLWVATKFGLTKYDGTNWTTYNTGNSNITNDTINCIYTQGSIIWIGTKNGVGKLQGANWTTYNSINSGLSTRNVNCLTIDLNNDLYVGTIVGLYRKSGTAWTDFATVSQYYNERMNVKSIYVDANNTKYIGGSGVFILSGNQFLNISYQYPNVMGVPFGTGNILIKGPRGGVMFNSYTEIYGSQAYRYSGVNIGNYIVNDNSGLIWGTDASSNHIYSFNYLNYTVNNPLIFDSSPNYAYLDINQVNAEILNRGDMFWDVYGSTNARYEVPKGSGRSAQFAASLWMGGVDNGGQLHVAAQTYRQSGNDFWPGPIDTVSGTADSITSVSFDRLWKLNRLNINEFRTQFALGNVQNGTYAVDSNIITWPAIGTGNFTRNMSPFVDVNHDGLYRPLIDGDYPIIKGDQEIYWIFNDDLPHTETGCLPMKVEVHASAYAYACPNITDSLNVLNYTTFYNYKIINRSAHNYHKAYIAFWDDADMGDYSDDYVGCNPSKNYGMLYNGSAVDGNGQMWQYGIKPPMISPVILNGPLAEPNDTIDNNNNGVIDEAGEKNLMTSFIYFNNDFNPINGNPVGCQNFFNYIEGYWGDSTHITYGGNGYGGTIPTNFMYSGALDVANSWSETSSNNVPSDRRFIMGCGPFNLNAGQMVEFDMAQVFTRDTVSAYTIGNLYEKNRDDVRRVQQWFAVDSFPSCLDLYTGTHELGIRNEELGIYPNPSSGLFTITSNSTIKKIQVFNLLGEVVYSSSSPSGRLGGAIDISQLSKGIYFMEVVTSDFHTMRKKIIIQ